MNEPLAPACYGSPSIFAYDSKCCRGCFAFEPCSQESFLTLDKIKGLVNVEDLLKHHAKARAHAQARLRLEDAAKAAARPPGNIPQPLLAVERKTKVLKVEFAVPKHLEAIVAKLSDDARVMTVNLFKSGQLDHIKSELSAGRNPHATTGPGWLRVSLSMILDGGFTKRSLAERLMADLKQTKQTAASYATNIWQVMVIAGLVKATEGGFVSCLRTVETMNTDNEALKGE